jgi:hypothetical protein
MKNVPSVSDNVPNVSIQLIGELIGRYNSLHEHEENVEGHVQDHVKGILTDLFSLTPAICEKKGNLQWAIRFLPTVIDEDEYILNLLVLFLQNNLEVKENEFMRGETDVSDVNDEEKDEDETSCGKRNERNDAKGNSLTKKSKRGNNVIDFNEEDKIEEYQQQLEVMRQWRSQHYPNQVYLRKETVSALGTLRPIDFIF